MIVGKQVADMITGTRAAFAVVLAWIGRVFGVASLPIAVLIMLLDWTGDILDGMFARRSSKQYQTWIGKRDLEVDVLVSLGLLIYLVGTGFANWQLAAVYMFVWVVVYFVLGMDRTLWMLFQAPIYAWFIWVALATIPSVGIWIVFWIVLVIWLTWPRFPEEVVPGFLHGLQTIWETYRKTEL